MRIKGKNISPSTPEFELPTSRSVGKRSTHCATYIYTSNFRRGTFSYLITYSRLKCPKTPVFPSSVAHSHFDLFAAFVFCLQHFGYLQCTSFICSVLFLFAAYFFLFAAYFFYLQRFFFVCSVSFLFAACPLWAIVLTSNILYISNTS